MKRLLKLIVIFINAIICTVSYQLFTPVHGICAYADISPDFQSNSIVVNIKTECIVLPLDKPRWHNSYTHKHSEGGILEYVPNNETRENWSELITIKYFTGTFAETTPLEYANMLEVFLKIKVDPMPQNSTFRLLEVSDTNALVEWKLKAHPDEIGEHTLTRIIRENNYLVVVEYTEKQVINETNRSVWIQQLKNAKLFEKKTDFQLLLVHHEEESL